MASMRCASCTLRALHIFVRSAGAELQLPNSIRSTPFHLRRSRSFAVPRDTFARHQSSLAAQSIRNSALDVDATRKADEPLIPIAEDTNDPVAALQSHRRRPRLATNTIDERKARDGRNEKQKVERKGKRVTKPVEHGRKVEYIDQEPPSAGKKAGKEKVRTSSRNAKREAARRGLTYEEFQEQDPDHPANIRAGRGENKLVETKAAKEAPKTRRKQVSDDKTSSRQPKAPRKPNSETKRPEWQIQKAALEEKFEEGWKPPKRLSPDALDGIRGLHQHDPDKFSTVMLSKYFEVSPEVIRRILRSKWKPSGEEHEDRMRRWDNRGKKIWEKMVELGVRPPKKWREMGVGKTVQEEAEAWKKHKRARQSLQAESRLADEFERESDSEPSLEQSLGDRIL